MQDPVSSQAGLHYQIATGIEVECFEGRIRRRESRDFLGFDPAEAKAAEVRGVRLRSSPRGLSCGTGGRNSPLRQDSGVFGAEYGIGQNGETLLRRNSGRRVLT